MDGLFYTSGKHFSDSIVDFFKNLIVFHIELYCGLQIPQGLTLRSIDSLRGGFYGMIEMELSSQVKFS